MRWIVLTGALLMTAAAGWWIVQVALLDSAERSTASGYGQFVLAVTGILIILAGAVRKAFTPGPPPSIDALATVMRDQWERAARERRLLEPAPLPIRWRRSKLPVAVPVAAATSTKAGQARFDPLPGLSHTTSARLREGNRSHLHSIYGGLASGRLVIAGPAGSGKSAAAILLLLDALRYRETATVEERARIPVPVMFTLHGWDPTTTRVQDWLLQKLSEIPLFRKGGAEAHLGAGRIAVFLDGLDEINEELRPVALRALSDQASFRLVLLTRSAELVEAAQQGPLAGAAAIDLQSVTPTDAREYLLRPLVSPAPAAWQAVADNLTTDPLAQALDNPLALTLLRDAYEPTGPVDELLDTTRFPTSEDIENHLLDCALITAYTSRPGKPPPRYSLDTARRTLGYVAQRLNQDGRRDLAWWDIRDWTRRVPRTILALLTAGLATTLLYGFAFWYLFRSLGGSLIGILLGVSTSVIAVSLNETEPMRLKNSWWRGLFTRTGFFFGLGFGAATGIGAVIFGWSALWLMFWLVAWLVFMFGIGTGTADLASIRSSSPLESWRQDVAAGLARGVATWLMLFAATISMLLWFDRSTAFRFGLALGPAALFAGGPLFTVSLYAFLAQIQIALHHHTPARLMRFLEDARSRHVLRTVGPVYQFRHAKLQDRLALRVGVRG